MNAKYDIFVDKGTIGSTKPGKLQDLVSFLQSWKGLGVLNDLEYCFDTITLDGFPRNPAKNALSYMWKTTVEAEIDVTTMKCKVIKGKSSKDLFFRVAGLYNDSPFPLGPEHFDYKHK